MDLIATLSQLENAQLVRPLTDSNVTYLFKHTLTQESVYEAMLKARRVELHRAVAHAIETLCDGQQEPHAAVLALHYERAGVEDKAFSYSALAGDLAARAYAQPEALDFYRRALAIAHRAGEPQWNRRVREIYTNRGRVLEVMGDHSGAMANYEEMIAFAQRTGDLAMEADGLSRLLTVQGVLGRVHNETLELQHTLDLARQSGDQALVGRALWNLGLAIRFQDPERAADYFRKTLELARTSGLTELAAYALSDLAVESQFLGQWRNTLEYAQQALAEFQALDNKPMIANALGLLSEAYYAKGEPERARAAAVEGTEISLAIENPWGSGYNQWSLFVLFVEAGEFDLALPLGEKLLAIAKTLETPLFWGLTNMVLCLAFIELNQLDRAAKCFEDGKEEAVAVGGPSFAGSVAGIYARLLFARNQVDQARAVLEPYWTESSLRTGNLSGVTFLGPIMCQLALVDSRIQDGLHLCETNLYRFEEQEMGRSIGEMLYYRGLLRERTGDLVGAIEDLTRAESIELAAKNNLLVWQIEAELSRLHSASGNAEPSRQALDKAHSLINAIANRIPDAALRESFLKRSDVQTLALPIDH